MTTFNELHLFVRTVLSLGSSKLRFVHPSAAFRCSLFFTTLFIFATSHAQNIYLCHGGTSGGVVNLYEVEIQTGSLVSSITLQPNTGGIEGVYGMARNPQNGVIYMLFDAGSGVRRLGTCDPITGDIVVIGQVYYIMQSMTFKSDGTCLAMTASNDDTPAQLVEVNINDASLNFVGDFDAWGGFGQGLAFHPGQNLIYRIDGGGGSGFGNEDFLWQTIDQMSYLELTGVQLNGFPALMFPYAIGLAYHQGNEFLVATNGSLYDMTSAGVLSGQRTLVSINSEITGMVLKDVASGVRSWELATLRIWPNPVADLLHFDLYGPVDGAVEVLDLQGRLVRSWPANSGHMALDVSDLCSGTYIVKAGQRTSRFTVE